MRGYALIGSKKNLTCTTTSKSIEQLEKKAQPDCIPEPTDIR